MTSTNAMISVHEMMAITSDRNPKPNRNKYFPRTKPMILQKTLPITEHDTSAAPGNGSKNPVSPSSTLISPSEDFGVKKDGQRVPTTTRPPKGPSRRHRRHDSDILSVLPNSQKKHQHRRTGSSPTALLEATSGDKISALDDDILSDLIYEKGSSNPRHQRRSSGDLFQTPNKNHRRTESSPAHLLRKSGEQLQDLYETLQESKGKFGDHHPKVSLAWNNIGNFHFKRGQLSTALKPYFEALQSYKTSLGDDHPFVATTTTNIGIAYWRLGDYESALKYLEQSCRIVRKTFGKDHLATGNALHNLGQVLCLRRDNNEAMFALKQAHDIRTDNLGQKHIDVARTLGLMGTVELQRGNLEESMKMQREALHLKRTLLGTRHHSVVISMLDVAYLHEKSGNFRESLAMYEEALQMQRTLKCGYDVGVTLHAIGKLQAKMGKMSEAKCKLEEAYAVYKDRGMTDDHKCMLALQKSLAAVNQSMAER